MRQIIPSVLAIAASSLMFAAAAQAEPFRIIVTHLEAPLVPNSVLDLALEEGYFERAGVDVELVRVQQTPSALAALRAGEGEMANVSTDALLQLVAQGVDLKAISSPNKSLPFMIVARDAIATPQELVGHSFGIGRLGSLDHSLSAKVLDTLGVSIDDLEMVAIGQPNIRAQSLIAGTIDATTVSIGVYTALPDKTGINVLVDQDAYYAAAPVVSKVNVVTPDVLANRAHDVAAVTRALIEISRDYAENPEAWVDAMDRVLPDVAREELEALAASYSESWAVDGDFARDELEYTADWFYSTEDFADVPAIALEDWADFSVLEGVLAEIGTFEASDGEAQ